jgi:integrase
LDSRDIKEVEKMRMEYIEFLAQNNYSTIPKPTLEVSNGDRYLLAYQMKRFLDYKTNGGTYEFESPKELEDETIKDYKRHFRFFLESLSSHINIKTIRIDEITKEHIDIFHKYIKRKTDSPKTYNNIMTSLRTFYNHLIKYEEFDVRNLFTLVTYHSVAYDPVTFTEEEFNRILAATTDEKVIGRRKKRSYYKDWLPTTFKLGLYSCLRLDELVHLKYSDIVLVDGLLVLQAENRKANKIIGENRMKNRRVKRIPVIEAMKSVLYEECGFEENKGSDKYIIAPELTRVTVHNIICKGFTHFKRLAGIDEQKCFKELRKTFITRMEVEYGRDFTTLVSDHSNDAVVRKHYIDQMGAVKKTAGLKIFP